MKSERANKYIDNDTIEFRNGDRMVDASTAYIAVELAEQEAEERILNKVHKTFMEMMTWLFHGEMPRTLADEFIQKLTEDETD